MKVLYPGVFEPTKWKFKGEDFFIFLREDRKKDSGAIALSESNYRSLMSSGLPGRGVV